MPKASKQLNQGKKDRGEAIDMGIDETGKPETKNAHIGSSENHKEKNRTEAIHMEIDETGPPETLASQR